MKIIPVFTKRWKPLLAIMLFGLITALATGLIERGGTGIPGFQNYGYPRIWRTTNLYGPTDYTLLNLAWNTLFWTAISLSAYTLVQLVFYRWNITWDITVDPRHLSLFLVLFIPLGLVMDLIHEGGHVFWGTLAGGHLTKLQIAYFQLYPTLTINPNFRLGYVAMGGLSTNFTKGLMGLGGSLTTHLAAWGIGLILLKFHLKPKIKRALFTLGLFGILDLPLYTFLPQVGLRHWVIIGGDYPEPLLAAQKLGVPSPMFYLIVILTTLTLSVLYKHTLYTKRSPPYTVMNESRDFEPKHAL